MSAYEWIVYKGKRILVMDFSGIDNSEAGIARARERMAIIEPVVEKEPPNSIYCLCDLTNGHVNSESTQMLKNFTKHNQPYMKMTAVIGVEGFQKVIFQGILMFTGRKNLILKNTKQEALDWLADQ
jgi:hypothetical protein